MAFTRQTIGIDMDMELKNDDASKRATEVSVKRIASDLNGVRDDSVSVYIHSYSD